ncbi:hypothetical protein RKD37_001175 [Streptomyces ambofaciens]
MQDGQDGGAGRQRGGGRQHVLRFFDEVGGDLGAAVGDVVGVVVAGLVVGSQFRAERGLDHRQLRRPAEHRTQTPGEPDDGDAHQRAQAGGGGDHGKLRGGVPQPLGDVARGDQRGDRARDGQESEGREDARPDLADQQADGRAAVHAPGHPHRAPHQRGQAPRHGAGGQQGPGLEPGLVAVEVFLFSNTSVPMLAVRRGPLGWLWRLVLCNGRGHRSPWDGRCGKVVRSNDAVAISNTRHSVVLESP